VKPAARSLLLLASFLFSACATLPTLPAVPPPAEEVFQQVISRREALQGLKGLAQVRVSSPGKSFHGQQVLFARRPGFLRVESLSPLGTPLLYLVTDGKEIRFYNPEENRFYQGDYRAGSLSFALPMDLHPAEVVNFLLGGGPLADPDQISLRPDSSEGLWVLELHSPSRGVTETLWVHPQSFHILRADLRRPSLFYRLSFSDFRQVKEKLFPHRMRLSSEDSRTRISVVFPEVDLNPDWEAQDFSLPVPQGATVHPFP
jgi:outer membrane lipoprotein-sorting protein